MKEDMFCSCKSTTVRISGYWEIPNHWTQLFRHSRAPDLSANSVDRSILFWVSFVLRDPVTYWAHRIDGYWGLLWEKIKPVTYVMKLLRIHKNPDQNSGLLTLPLPVLFSLVSVWKCKCGYPSAVRWHPFWENSQEDYHQHTALSHPHWAAGTNHGVP